MPDRIKTEKLQIKNIWKNLNRLQVGKTLKILLVTQSDSKSLDPERPEEFIHQIPVSSFIDGVEFEETKMASQ